MEREHLARLIILRPFLLRFRPVQRRIFRELLALGQLPCALQIRADGVRDIPDLFMCSRDDQQGAHLAPHVRDGGRFPVRLANSEANFAPMDFANSPHCFQTAIPFRWILPQRFHRGLILLIELPLYFSHRNAIEIGTAF